MDDDDKSLKLRVPKERVVYDRKLNVYWVDLGDGDTFLRQILMGMANPGQAIVQKAKE